MRPDLIGDRSGGQIFWTSTKTGEVVDKTSLMYLVDSHTEDNGGLNPTIVEMARVIEEVEGTVQIDLDNPYGNLKERE